MGRPHAPGEGSWQPGGSTHAHTLSTASPQSLSTMITRSQSADGTRGGPGAGLEGSTSTSGRTAWRCTRSPGGSPRAQECARRIASSWQPN